MVASQTHGTHGSRLITTFKSFRLACVYVGKQLKYCANGCKSESCKCPLKGRGREKREEEMKDTQSSIRHLMNEMVKTHIFMALLRLPHSIFNARHFRLYPVCMSVCLCAYPYINSADFITEHGKVV